MDKKAFLLCPYCKTITEGTGTGENEDIIRCNECHNDVTASRCIDAWRNASPGILKIDNCSLYIPKDLTLC